MSRSYTSAARRMSLVRRRRAALVGPVAPTPLQLRVIDPPWDALPHWTYTHPRVLPHTDYGRLARIHPDTDDADSPCEAEEWQYAQPRLYRGLPWLMSHRDDTWVVLITHEHSLGGHDRPRLQHPSGLSLPDRPRGVV